MDVVEGRPEVLDEVVECSQSGPVGRSEMGWVSQEPGAVRAMNSAVLPLVTDCFTNRSFAFSGRWSVDPVERCGGERVTHAVPIDRGRS